MKSTNIDFMKLSRIVLPVALILVFVGVAIDGFSGLNYGIEFTGGTEVQIKYADSPDLGDIRTRLSQAGVAGSSVTRIGKAEDNEVYIRVAGTLEDHEAKDKDPTSAVVGALRQGDDTTHDVNVMDESSLANLLSGSDAVSKAQAAEMAKRILAQRTASAIFHSVQELGTIDGVSPEAVSHLESTATAGPFAVRSQSYIGPAIGRELKEKAGLAIIGSLVGMLLYIWVRFQFQWGFAAVLAVAHDAIVTLALFALFNKEMSLSVVAAFLTLVGYSVNDTVVVFDRIRENLSKMAGQPFEDVINRSINQTLSRTVLTSGLTLVVTVSLLIFGGAALNPFAFVLTVGVVVGTYSSIFVASPILVLWRRYVSAKPSGGPGSVSTGREDGAGRGARKARRTRKVRAIATD